MRDRWLGVGGGRCLLFHWLDLLNGERWGWLGAGGIVVASLIGIVGVNQGGRGGQIRKERIGGRYLPLTIFFFQILSGKSIYKESRVIFGKNPVITGAVVVLLVVIQNHVCRSPLLQTAYL